MEKLFIVNRDILNLKQLSFISMYSNFRVKLLPWRDLSLNEIQLKNEFPFAIHW